MSETSPTPEDLERARRLGERLERGDALSASGADDETMRALAAYREQRRRAEEAIPPADTSEQIWAAIERETAGDESAQQETRIYMLSSALRWAVAACVLMLVGVSYLLFFDLPDPELVASSGGSIQTYYTPDGSEIRLRPYSRLYRVDDADADRYRLQGEAFFAVTSRDERPFMVDADDAIVRVLGTDFNVSTWGTNTEVYLDEGRVELVYEVTGETVQLEAGQLGVVGVDGTLSTFEKADRSSQLGWLDGVMVFQERPLPEVLNELEHHFDVFLQVPQSMQGQTLTGRILLDNRERALSDLGVVLGGQFERVDPQIYRLEREAEPDSGDASGEN